MVVLIIGVTATLVTPRLMDLGEVRMKESMRRFQGTVRYLFNESVFRKQAYQLHIDIQKGEYWVMTPQVQGDQVEDIAFANPFVDKRGQFHHSVEIKSVSSPRHGRRSSGEIVIQFFPHGYVEPATIHLEDRHRNRYTLWIQPVTGSVRILDGHVEVSRRN